jgi:hypothetical protein
MKFFTSPIFAFALLLLVLLPATATTPTEQGRMIELDFVASSSIFEGQPVTVKVREGEASMLKVYLPGKGYFQYTVHAQQPALDSLPSMAQKMPQPLMVSIRVDTSMDGKTWTLQTQSKVLTSLGSTLSIEMSDIEKATSLLLSSRLLGDAGQRKSK